MLVKPYLAKTLLVLLIVTASLMLSAAYSQTSVSQNDYPHIIDLGSPPMLTSPPAPSMSNNGQLVGMPTGEAGWFRSFLYETAAHEFITFSRQSNRAASINGAGQMVGTMENAEGNYHAHLWHGGTLHDLGTLPGFSKSVAFGINNQTQVVGRLEDSAGKRRAFLWQDGTVIDLNTLIDPSLGWVLETAYLISHGYQVTLNPESLGLPRSVTLSLHHGAQVAGVGTLHGQPHAFLLTLPVAIP